MSHITSLTLAETLSALSNKEFSKKELNNAYLKRIDQVDPLLNSYLYVNRASHKIPAAIKDLIAVKNMQMTCGSKILEGYIAPYNAAVIEKLAAKDVSFIGKANMDEFAMGSSGENSAYGPTKNPWNIAKVPGGSSSGSAAAVAADLCTFALGTDTGGSIRQPASLCGVVGLKPSYGRVSRYGAQAMGSSLDQIGPITKTVNDSRLVLEWISGGDLFDSNATKEAFKPKVHLQDLNGIKVGVPKEYFSEGLDKKVEGVIKNAIMNFEELGAKIIDIDLPHTQYGIAIYYVIMFSEVSSNLARFDGIRFGKSRSEFGLEPKRRIMLGTYTLSSGYFDDYFVKASHARSKIKEDFAMAFQKCDVIVGPVSPTVAWAIGEKADDPLTMYLSDVYTVPASLAGIPGLSVPCGFVDGLPVGLQILGKYMHEEKILNVAEVYEKSTNWHKMKPDL